MIPAGRLLASIRYRLGDMQGVRFSDFELLEAVNRAASLLFSRLGRRYVWAAIKKTVLLVDEETLCARLPSDFHNMKRLSSENGGEMGPGQYRVMGEWFYAPVGAYGLEYYYLPRAVLTPEGELDAPEAVSPWVEQAALSVLNGDMAGAAQSAEGCCDALAAGEIGRFSDRGPVQVLGGRL